MQTTLTERFNELFNGNYEVEIGKYIGQAWDNFAKNPLGYIGYTLVIFAVSLLASFIPFLGIIVVVFTIGFAVVANKIHHGETTTFNDFFDGFNRKPFQLILVALIPALLAILAFIPFLFAGLGSFISINMFEFGDFSDNLPVVVVGICVVLAVVIGLILFYLYVTWQWAYFLVAFNGMDFWPAMETSRKIISKKWFSFFLFLIVLGIINLIGTAICGIGLIVTIPLTSIATFYAFKEITGFNEVGPLDTEKAIV